MPSGDNKEYGEPFISSLTEKSAVIGGDLFIIEDSEDGYIKKKVQGSCVGSGGTIVSKVAADSPYTALAADGTILCNCTAGVITVNLPTAVGIAGKIYHIKKTDSTASAVTVDPAGAETVDDGATLTISFQNETWTVQSDGTNWRLI